MNRLRQLINLGMGIGVLAASVVGVLWLLATKPPADRAADPRSVPSVELLAVDPEVFDAPIIGYGTVRPQRQVKIIPEVGGQLVAVHEDLAVGNIIAKGELLFEIDSRTYEARVRQVEAEIRRLEAQLSRHAEQQVHLERRLALAQERAELARRNLDRDEELYEQGAGVTDPEIEQSKERYLRQKDAVLAYEAQLAMIPLQVEETTALLATHRAQLEEAKLNVERTKIRCPFDARVDAVTAQASQVVIASLQIATLTDMEALEVPVVIDPRDLRWTDQRAFVPAIGEGTVGAPEARITWMLFGQEVSWTGRITRLERMDEVTRSAYVVVEIRDIMRSLESAEWRDEPPLSVGMFCRAELPTEPLDGALVIPRHALRDGDVVYVFQPDPADADCGRLAIRRVSVLRSVDDEVLVDYAGQDGVGDASAGGAAALQAGDLVVTSVLPKAVEGMSLRRREAASTPVLARSAAPEFPLPHQYGRHSPRSVQLLGAVTGAR
jgi:multidrug efflux pump subunit AcrA (membrane-fusion protein)